MSKTKLVSMIRCTDPYQVGSTCAHYHSSGIGVVTSDGRRFYCVHAVGAGVDICTCPELVQEVDDGDPACVDCGENLPEYECEPEVIPDGGLRCLGCVIRQRDEARAKLETIRRLISGEQSSQIPVIQAIANVFIGYVHVPADGDGSADKKLDKMKADAAGYTRRFDEKDKKAAENAIGRGSRGDREGCMTQDDDQ